MLIEKHCPTPLGTSPQVLISSTPSLGGGGGLYLMTLSPHNVLPDIPELLDSDGFDEEVHRSVRDPPQHHPGFTVGGHHCGNDSR